MDLMSLYHKHINCDKTSYKDMTTNLVGPKDEVTIDTAGNLERCLSLLSHGKKETAKVVK